MSACRGVVIGTSLVAALMHPSPVAAQLSSITVPVAVGQKVKITAADGRSLKGKVSLVTPQSIELPGISITAADILRVQLSDSPWDGAGKGAVIGGLIGVATGLLADGLQSAFGNSTGYFAVGGGAGLAIGGVLGAAFDAAHVKTIYERGGSGPSVGVRPIASSAGRGIGVSVRW